MRITRTMTFSYSLSSSSRSSISSRGRRHWKYGIPVSCFCGGAAVIQTSHTEANPGRRLYTCVNNNNGGCHIRKWLDEAILEELSDIGYKLSDMSDRITHCYNETTKMHSHCVGWAQLETVRRNLELATEKINQLKVMGGVGDSDAIESPLKTVVVVRVVAIIMAMVMCFIN